MDKSVYRHPALQVLLAGAETGCADDALTVVAMMSTDPVFTNPGCAHLTYSQNMHFPEGECRECLSAVKRGKAEQLSAFRQACTCERWFLAHAVCLQAGSSGMPQQRRGGALCRPSATT